jgi:hypothetical protein
MLLTLQFRTDVDARPKCVWPAPSPRRPSPRHPPPPSYSSPVSVHLLRKFAYFSTVGFIRMRAFTCARARQDGMGGGG